MMTIETVKKADALIYERDRIAAAKWNAVVHQTSIYHGGAPTSEAADEPLALAIEEFRKRKLDAIDAELCELGVEPPQMPAAEAEVEEPTRLRSVRV